MTTHVQIKEGKSTWHKLDTSPNPKLVRDVIEHETHNFGFWLLVMGFVQLVASHFLDPSWGVVLLVIGAASFYFRTAAMLPVYGVTLAWAAVCNVLSGDLRWSMLGLFQAYWAFTTFWQFRTIYRATRRLGIGLGTDAADAHDRAAGIFPWAGCAFTAVAPIGLVALIIVAAVWSLLTGQDLSNRTLGLAFTALIDSACLGLALGVAALLARFRWPAASILAALGGGLMLGFCLVLMFLA